jgi:heme-degrading monooxygenase HmoA
MAEYRAFRVTLRMQVRPGKGEEFEQAWYDGADVITSQPANLGQWLSKSADEENVYYIVSDWIDEPLFREYELSQEHLDHRVQLHPFRESGSMTTMHVLYQMAGARA